MTDCRAGVLAVLTGPCPRPPLPLLSLLSLSLSLSLSLPPLSPAIIHHGNNHRAVFCAGTPILLFNCTDRRLVGLFIALEPVYGAPGVAPMSLRCKVMNVFTGQALGEEDYLPFFVVGAPCASSPFTLFCGCSHTPTVARRVLWAGLPPRLYGCWYGSRWTSMVSQRALLCSLDGWSFCAALLRVYAVRW